MIGNIVRQARKARGLTQAELAAMVGAHMRTIQRIEADKYSRCQDRVGHALAGVLNINIDALLGLPKWSSASKGARLRILRRRKGWAREKTADRAGIHPATILDWETGRYKPTPDLLDCLTQVLCGRQGDVLEGPDPWEGGAA